jgi:hypothetical protein
LSGISSSGSNGRLNLLIVLVVVQIVLLVIILLNQQTETDDSRAVTEMRQLLIDIDQTAARLDAISEQQVINTQNAVIPANVVMSTKPDENMSDEDEIVAIKVQVLNGCGIAGIASKAAKWLQRNGYVVEDIGNADRQDINLTSIVDRSGNLTAARELASLLGISEDQIKRQGSGPKPKVDLTLIIGKDCKRLPIGR